MSEGEGTGMGKKIDIAVLKSVVGTLYPPPFAEPAGHCALQRQKFLLSPLPVIADVCVFHKTPQGWRGFFVARPDASGLSPASPFSSAHR